MTHKRNAPAIERRQSLSVRLRTGERSLVAIAARAREERLTQFIRAAALKEARRVLAQGQR